MDITLSLKELRVVLFGKTGVGKSLLGNSLLQKKLFESRTDTGSVTSACEMGTRNLDDHTHLVVVDTPGIFDTRKTNAETAKEVVKCIGLSAPGPHVFIFVLSIATRFTDEELNTFQCFKDTFGESVMNHVMIVFTCKDSLDFEDITLDTYIAKASPKLQNILAECGGRATAINNRAKQDNRHQDVEAIFDLIQKTMKTNNDAFYTGDMYKAAERVLQAKLQRLEEEKHKKERELEEKAKQIEEDAKQTQTKMEEAMEQFKQSEKLEREKERQQKKTEIAEYQKKQTILEKEIERRNQEMVEKSDNIWKKSEREVRRFFKRL